MRELKYSLVNFAGACDSDQNANAHHAWSFVEYNCGLL